MKTIKKYYFYKIKSKYYIKGKILNYNKKIINFSINNKKHINILI